MSTRIRKESEAWREIARRIAEGEWEEDGLCSEITALEESGQIEESIADEASARVRRHLDGGVYDPDFDTRDGIRVCYAMEPGMAEPRVLAALWLALEAKESEGGSHG